MIHNYRHSKYEYSSHTISIDADAEDAEKISRIVGLVMAAVPEGKIIEQEANNANHN